MWRQTVLCSRLADRYQIAMGTINKRRSQLEEGGCPVRRFCGQGEFFKCGRSHFLERNTTDFSKFMVCPHGQGGRGLSQCGHFAGKGGEVNFSRFCADVYCCISHKLIRCEGKNSFFVKSLQ